jgi:hypothetical protein
MAMKSGGRHELLLDWLLLPECKDGTGGGIWLVLYVLLYEAEGVLSVVLLGADAQA